MIFINSYPTDVLSKILESDGLFTNEEQKALCEGLVEELTDEEQELAAQSSYAYWLFARSTSQQQSQQQPQQQDADDKLVGGGGADIASACTTTRRFRMAMREARRHLVAENGDFALALTRLRGACHFRKEYHLDILRCCFDQEDQPATPTTAATGSVDGTDNTSTASSPIAPAPSVPPNPIRDKYRGYIAEELHNQVMVVRGMDRSNRAVVLKLPRDSVTSDTMNVDAYVLAHLYMAERALAATERESQGTVEKVVVVFHFANYSSRNAPTLVAIRKLVSILQQNYPERLKYLVVLDPPMWMRGLVNLIYPFLSTDTKEKVRLVSGDGQRQTILQDIIDTDQAMPFMLQGGKLQGDISVSRFLHDVAFHHLYDQGEKNKVGC